MLLKSAAGTPQRLSAVYSSSAEATTMESIIQTVRKDEYPQRKRNALGPFCVLPSAGSWSVHVLRSTGWTASPWFLFEVGKTAVLLILAAASAYLLWKHWEKPAQDMPSMVWTLNLALGLCGLLSLFVDLIIYR
jgi:hypothetical protein